MLCELLKDYNPSFLRGDGIGKWTDSKYFIFEACEYKNHFLSYKPDEAIILNIDYDHNDYFNSFEDYKNSFKNFAKNVKERVYLNSDIYDFNNIKNIITFGENNIISNNNSSIIYNNKTIKNVRFSALQKELIINQIGIVICALNLGVKPSKIRKYLLEFKGVKRRKEEMIIKDDIFIDDYAHHPSQIRVIIEECKLKYPSKNIIAIFKPDRYSRILQFHKEIYESLSTADKAFVLPFPVNSKNDTNEIFDASIIGIDVLEEKELIEELKKYSNCVYLFLSSKDLSYIRKELMSFKFDIN